MPAPSQLGSCAAVSSPELGLSIAASVMRACRPARSAQKYRVFRGPVRPYRARLSRLHRASDGTPGDSGGGSESVPKEMSLTDAYRMLGLQEGAGYEAVLSAKNALLSRNKNNRERCLEIEMAYDRIFISQLKARMSGELRVAESVRFADVGQRRRMAAPSISMGAVPPVRVVTIAPLRDKSALITSAIFGGLAAWALIEGLLVPNPAAAAREVPGLQLALGALAAVYFLRNEKQVLLYKAFGFTFLGILAGTAIGSGLESWLRVDIVPLGSLSSPGTVVGECALAAMFAVAFFLA